MNLQKSLISLLVAGALALTACSPQAPVEPTAEPTLTEFPTDTPEPTATETLIPEPSATQDLTAQPEGATTQAAGGAVATQAQQAPASSAADRYQYINQTIPDGYQVRPRVTVTIAWTVKNVGTTAWDKTYGLRQFAGPNIDKGYVPFPKTVSANEMASLSVTFTTPETLGDYNLWYKLTNTQGENFGDVNFQFTVTNSPSSKPAAATATP